MAARLTLSAPVLLHFCDVNEAFWFVIKRWPKDTERLINQDMAVGKGRTPCQTLDLVLIQCLKVSQTFNVGGRKKKPVFPELFFFLAQVITVNRNGLRLIKFALNLLHCLK